MAKKHPEFAETCSMYKKSAETETIKLDLWRQGTKSLGKFLQTIAKRHVD